MEKSKAKTAVNEWPKTKTYRIPELEHAELLNIMKTYNFTTENEAVKYVLMTHMGMVHQLGIVNKALNEAEAEVEEFENIKTRFREVLVDLGILSPSATFKDEEE